LAYRKATATSARIAVLVQPMLHPQAAGVAFSADPVTGDRNVTTVEAVAGLGDQLVTGTAEPQRWRVVDDRLRDQHDASVLSEDQVRSIAETVRRVADLFGWPQDVEWAIAGDRLWLLQARPITGLSDRDSPELVPIPIQVPPGNWQREAEHSPRPPSPLSASDTGNSFKSVLDEFGVLVDVDFAVIGGWEYVQIRPVGAPRSRGAFPAEPQARRRATPLAAPGALQGRPSGPAQDRSC
jgi:pyruvate,water dikinase